jgi:hypothetical protein
MVREFRGKFSETLTERARMTLAARTLAMQFEKLLVGPFSEYPVVVLPLSLHFASQRASSISREGAAFSKYVARSEPSNASDTSSLDPAGNMGKYMKVLIAIALIIGGVCVMVCAELKLVSDLVRRPRALSADREDG